MRNSKLIAAVTIAAAILVTACSSDESSEVNKEAVVQMAAASLEAEAGFYSEEYTECLLEGVVEIAEVSWSDIQEALELDGTLENLAVETSLSEEKQEEIGALALTCMADTDILQDLMDDTIDDIMNDSRCEALAPECGWEWNEETQEWDDVWGTDE